LEAIKHGNSDTDDMVAQYDQRRRLIVAGLNQIGLECVLPNGAFYAFPSIKSTGLSSEEFSERLLFEEKVAVVPGNAFGDCGEGYVRCCYATGIDKIETALERMEKFLKKL
jgi:aminotransferase